MSFAVQYRDFVYIWLQNVVVVDRLPVPLHISFKQLKNGVIENAFYKTMKAF
jgi:hypothetical protein